jgi:hypothetical protein
VVASGSRFGLYNALIITIVKLMGKGGIVSIVNIAKTLSLSPRPQFRTSTLFRTIHMLDN